jgi:putative ABC transport system ATP-binding protein
MEVLAAFNNERGITIALVTHDADMATYAERIIRFLDGIIDSEEENGETA